MKMLENHLEKALNNMTHGKEGMLFKHGTRLDVPQMSHLTEIILQFCGSEPSDCPFP